MKRRTACSVQLGHWRGDPQCRGRPRAANEVSTISESPARSVLAAASTTATSTSTTIAATTTPVNYSSNKFRQAAFAMPLSRRWLAKDVVAELELPINAQVEVRHEIPTHFPTRGPRFDMDACTRRVVNIWSAAGEQV